jgi:hypothetical protein
MDNGYRTGSGTFRHSLEKEPAVHTIYREYTRYQY